MDSLKGLEALQDKILSLSDRGRMAQFMRQEAENLLSEVQKSIDELPISRVKRAQLRDSLTLEAGSDGLSWTISSSSEYGTLLEFGSENTTLLPWLGPSLVSYRGQYCNCLRDRLITTLSTSGSSG